MKKIHVLAKTIKHTSKTMFVNEGMTESINPKSLANLFNIRPERKHNVAESSMSIEAERLIERHMVENIFKKRIFIIKLCLKNKKL